MDDPEEFLPCDSKFYIDVESFTSQMFYALQSNTFCYDNFHDFHFPPVLHFILFYYIGYVNDCKIIGPIQLFCRMEHTIYM